MAIPIRSVVAMAFVKSVTASIEFYRRVGFDVGNTVTDRGEAEPRWAWLRSDGAHLMVARATAPVIASEQAVLFYLYVDDVAAKQAELKSAGVAAAEIAYPFYAPKGEFRIEDPDGYVLMVTHT
jgi:predicted enzyme related to lactoylglutathione lyase